MEIGQHDSGWSYAKAKHETIHILSESKGNMMRKLTDQVYLMCSCLTKSTYGCPKKVLKKRSGIEWCKTKPTFPAWLMKNCSQQSEKSVVRELMAQYGSVQQMLWQASEQELEKIKGIGAVKARKIQCIAEIAKRVYRVNNALPPVIKSPGDAFSGWRICSFSQWNSFG